jgi:hypothetical protein
VDVEIIEYVPGSYGLTQVEWTALTIVATKLFDEVYDRTKHMLIERRHAKKETDGSGGRHLGLIIYGPDGEQLKSWDTRDEE